MMCNRCRMLQRRLDEAMDDSAWKSARIRELGQIVGTLGLLYDAQERTGKPARLRVSEGTMRHAWHLCGGGTEGGFDRYIKSSRSR